MATNMQARLQVAKQASFISGDELRRQFEGDWHRADREHGVNTAAHESREAIRIFLEQVYPGEQIVGKGMGEVPTTGSYWLIDSLNGAENFSAGDEYFATTVAWVENGQASIGVVSEPSKRALFWATKGGGAWYADTKLSVRAVAQLSEAFILLGLGQQEARSTSVETITRLAPKVRQLKGREAPALELCAVAAGTHDAFIHHDLESWDWMAAKLILEEAGGTMTDPAGATLTLTSRDIVASNGALHTELLAALKA
ncbi:hypothetical protein HY374_00255 [Candidatus Berkelbacteria bacterium]|nr:hypothetical protein [Candidatus Berkelbacteria bacterium]